MIVLLLPSSTSRRYHSTTCSTVQRSAPKALGCEHVDIQEAQRRGYTWCRSCQRSEVVA
jgi:hypothetical protein